jgi:hypothetical protein
VNKLLNLSPLCAEFIIISKVYIEMPPHWPTYYGLHRDASILANLGTLRCFQQHPSLSFLTDVINKLLSYRPFVAPASVLSNLRTNY